MAASRTAQSSTRSAPPEAPHRLRDGPQARRGTADFELGDAVRLLREAGHEEQAARVEHAIVGRNVIPGH